MRISESWKQQKPTSHLGVSNHKKRHGTRKTSVLTKSLLHRTSQSSAAAAVSEFSDSDECVISPPTKTKKTRSTRNRSVLVKSLLRSPSVSTALHVSNECSPPANTKKIQDTSGDNMALGTSIEWGCGDSILNGIDIISSPIEEKFDMPVKPSFTKVVNMVCTGSPIHQVSDKGKEFENSGPRQCSKGDGLVKSFPIDVSCNKHDQHSVSNIAGTSCTQTCPVPSASRESDDNEPKHCKTKPELVESIKPVTSSVGDNLCMSAWGLPESVLENYKSNGIEHMFPWQKECLLTGEALSGGNLVYSAPTSAGKTLVAEILMLKRVMDTKKKALYILPFVSVSREKMYSLRDLYKEADIKVGGFMGGDSPAGGLNAVDVAVCTIEKANSLINRLMEEKNIAFISCIVVDELHMVGDSGRGYLLELLLTKIRFVSSSVTTVDEKDKFNRVQLIGMSATLPNLSMLASWLAADLYCTDFRPVPLRELIKAGRKLLDKYDKDVSDISEFGNIQGDEDGVVPLCIETIKEGNSVLIFCPTKNWCEKLAETISKFFATNRLAVFEDSSTFKKASKLLAEKSNIDDILDQLRNCPVGLDEIIEKVVKQKVAFHHAGLTMDERDIIEGAFRRGVLRVLVATSTLSSGVNLPAKRVIIRSPMFYGKVLDSLVYKQMSGRAGRKGIDTSGESIIICKPTEKKHALSLLQSDLKPVYSCLLDSHSGKSGYKTMKRALLEIITGGIAVTPEGVKQYEKSTYLHTCLSEMKGCDFEEAMGSTIDFLLQNEFITLQQVDDTGAQRYHPTQLGSACLASSFSPDEALVVFSELRKARKNFVLENELHLIYQVTPIYLQDQWTDLDWYLYYNLWERLPSQYKHVGEMVGVEERFLAKAVRNSIPVKTEQQRDTLRIHRRFYTALVLQELVNEIPLPVISKRYKINKGMLQSLQNAAATFAGMLTSFCRKLGWTCLEVLLDQFQSRLTFGVGRELCNLVRISLLSGFKARLLYDRGYETVSVLAFANKDDIACLLRESVPFESRRVGDKVESNSTKVNCRNIWLIGKEGLTEYEAAELIIHEAQKVLKADAAALGLNMQALSGNTEAPDRRTPVTRRSGSSSSAVRKSGSSGQKRRSKNFSKGSRKAKSRKKGNTSRNSSMSSEYSDYTSYDENKENCVVKEKSATETATYKCEEKCIQEAENADPLLLPDTESENIDTRVKEDVQKANGANSISLRSAGSEILNGNKASLDGCMSDMDIEKGEETKRRSSLLYSDPEFENCIEMLNWKKSPFEVVTENNNHCSKKIQANSLLPLNDKCEEPFAIDKNNLSPSNNIHVSIERSKVAEMESSNRINTPICRNNDPCEYQITPSSLFSDNEFEKCIVMSNEKDSDTKPICDKEYTKVNKRNSSSLFSETEFDFGSLNISSSSANAEDREITGNTPTKPFDIPALPNVLPLKATNKDTVKYDAIGAQKSTVNSDFHLSNVSTKSGKGGDSISNKNDIPSNLAKHNINDVHNNSGDVKGSEIIKSDNISNDDGIRGESYSQFVNMSNDSMFLLSNSMFQHLSSPSEALPSKRPCSPVVENSPVVPLKLESQFNEVFSEEKNTSSSINSGDLRLKEGVKVCEDRSNTDCPSNEEVAANAGEPDESIFSQDLFKNDISVMEADSCLEATQCDEFLIIDVASNKDLFLTFRKEWGQKKRYSFCFACERNMQRRSDSIGKNLRPQKAPLSKGNKRDYVYQSDGVVVVGLAVCWGGKDSYYINLEPDETGDIDLNDTNLEPLVAKELSVSSRLKVLKSILLKQSNSRNVICYDMKEQLKILFGLFECLLPNAVLMDPRVAQWILAPSDKGKNLHGLVTEYLSDDYVNMLQAVGGEFGIKCLSSSPQMRGKSRMRACIEAVVTYNVMEALEERLNKDDLYQPFIEVEMPSIRTLTVIEINGIGFSNSQCETLKEVMKGKLDSIERECYQLAHRTFSMTSPDEVSRVLFVDLGLPPNGVIEENPVRRQTRSKPGQKRKRFATTKAVLEKLQKLHRLPKLILEWRRVNSALTKVVYPLQRKKVSVTSLQMDRVYSESQYHTSTGRVTFSEPNLQNVPREFDIKLPILIGDSPPVGNKGRKRVINGMRACSTSADVGHPEEPVSPGEAFAISIRSIFVPFDTATFISADYCQLELRLIAHLSGDKKLIRVLNTSSDVFKGIAADIHHTCIDKVNDTQRQHAKEICYGIIYGMGSKSLSEQLGVSEEDASAYMEQFKDKYSGIKQYIRTTIESTCKNGFVTTLCGRRRYLPAINSSNPYAKSQSERQTVNTAVQGSAADLIKKAMNSIDTKLTKQFGRTCINRTTSLSDHKGAFLLLQLHDELLYEVSKNEIRIVSEIIRCEMENVVQLAVKIPVKVKTGSSWGSLKEI